MRISLKFSFFSFLVIVLLGTFSLLASKTSAQAIPQMAITWHAYGSYIPSGYLGKALPNQESKISASLALIINGRSIALSGQTVYWYLNDTLIGGGTGKTYIIFSPLGTAPAYLTLRAEIPSYNGNLLMHDVQIPLINPNAVIEASHPSEQFMGTNIVLRGVPYFFYVSDPSTLSYSWSVNGETSAAKENPDVLQMNIDPSTPSGSSFNTSLTIRNTNDNTSGNDSTNIIYIKQL